MTREQKLLIENFDTIATKIRQALIDHCDDGQCEDVDLDLAFINEKMLDVAEAAACDIDALETELNHVQL